MKKFKACLLALLLVLAMLLLAACQGVSVTRVYVNDEMHAIAEFSDGTTKDLGYVGVEVKVEVPVEVVPPLYTVIFYDASGAVLSVQEVYKGTAAKAPDAPEVADKSFDKWDKDFSSVTGNMSVYPVYVDADTYPVIFKGADGTVLATENVIHGHAATAPAPPTLPDKVFTGWDKDFSNVKGELTVTAQYRDKNTYTVTFKDMDGTVLKTENVKEGGNATPPTAPTQDGFTFTGWSGKYTGVNKNTVVIAQYTENISDIRNLLRITYVDNGNGTLTVKVKLTGDVKVKSIGGALKFDSSLLKCTSVATTCGGTFMTSLAQSTAADTIRFAYAHSAEVTSGCELFEATLTYDGDAFDTQLQLTIEELVDGSYAPEDYTVQGGAIKVQ